MPAARRAWERALSSRPAWRIFSPPRQMGRSVSSPLRRRAAPPPRRRSRGKRERGGAGASLLRGARFEPVLEASIEISIDGEVVGQELRVELDDFGEALLFLPVVDAGDGNDQRGCRQEDAGGKAS